MLVGFPFLLVYDKVASYRHLFAVYMGVLITRLIRQRGFGCKLADCFYGCLVYRMVNI